MVGGRRYWTVIEEPRLLPWRLGAVRRSTLASVPCILVIAMLATGCARLGAGGTNSGSADLTGVWNLVRGTGQDGELRVSAGSRVTIAFEGDRVSGQACNLYSGSYRLGERGAISFSEMGMTEMACQEPMMSLEATYHAALTLVRSVAIEGDRLTLSGDGVELVFDRQPAVRDASLTGTTWVLDTLIRGDAASSVSGKAWLILNADGTLSGATGCRDFSGTYLLDGDRLQVDQLVNSDIACEASINGQDLLVLQVLSLRPVVEIQGDRLTLTAGNAGLGYRVGER
jgi:heat shock protein HslJ